MPRRMLFYGAIGELLELGSSRWLVGHDGNFFSQTRVKWSCLGHSLAAVKVSELDPDAVKELLTAPLQAGAIPGRFVARRMSRLL